VAYRDQVQVSQLVTIVKTIVIILATGAAVVGLWGAGVESGRLTWQGIILLTLILLGAVFGIAEEIVRTRTEKRDAERRERQAKAERHWNSLEAQQIVSLHIAIFVKAAVPVGHFLELLRGVHFHFTPDSSQHLHLWQTLSFPQLQGRSCSWEESAQPDGIDGEAVAWLWMLYPAKAGYWWKNTSHDWTSPDVSAAGVDAEIPWATVSQGAVASLRELAAISRFGVTLPWKLVGLGIEEVSLQFRTRTSSLDFDFSEHGLEGLAWLQREQRRAVPPSSYLPLGISLSGQQLEDELRRAFTRRELGEAEAKPYRGIMGLSGPGGRSVRFFPDMPREFMDSEASREFSFTVTLPAR
jgi:hypothetical protein